MLNRMLTQKEQFLLLFVGLAIVLGALALTIAQRKTEAIMPPAPDTIGTAARALPGKARVPIEGKKASVEASAEAQSVVVPSSPDSAVTPVSSQAVSPPAEEAAPASKHAEIAVAVMGAVAKEGLYHLREGARVGDLLEKAGGALEEAELGDINLGAPLIDGSTLSLPRRASARVEDDGTLKLRGADRTTPPNPPEYTRAYAAQHVERPSAAQRSVGKDGTAGASVKNPAADAGDGLIDLNRASPAELATLPGIGPALAQRIVDYRTTTPFKAIEQLDEVPGIGPKRMEQLRPHVKVQ